ncbi:hypothetical protein [Nonomuraea sp. PA05]|uniref:hypothetical protein n=1 Tax=Nonomuraea sp. PA05 TaxID=2604466 RepID=UPI0016526101|nr:hypothetical protein [Nonomuraea sp. PA05]
MSIKRAVPLSVAGSRRGGARPDLYLRFGAPGGVPCHGDTAGLFITWLDNSGKPTL